MKSVLITGVGGGVGQSILKSLSGSEFKLVAIDSSPLAAGLYMNGKPYLGLPASDSHYIDRIIQICEMENVGLIFPGHDVELKPLAASKKRLLNLGIHVSVSSEEVISICDDKLLTAKFLGEKGFRVPGTWKLSEFEWNEGSFILKPQVGGARSKQTYLCQDQNQFIKFTQLVDINNCVVQEYIPGEEYTCGSVTLNGICQDVILMRRTLRSGDTYKAFVVHDEYLQKQVQSAVNALGVEGACNVQLKYYEGEPYIFEINARSSGTTAARTLVGFNEPLAIANHILLGKRTAMRAEEKTILRYWQEILVENSEILDELDSKESRTKE